MDLANIAEETQAKVLQYLDSTDGWKNCQKFTKDVVIEVKPSPDFDGNIYRLTRMLDGSYQDLFKYVTLNTINWKAEWDKDTASNEVLQQIGENTQLIRRTTNSLALGLISSRDFVDVVKSEITDTVAVVTASSVELPEYPPVEKCVRGVSYPWGIRCLKESEKRTRFQIILQLDLKGKLPTSLVESTLPAVQLSLLKNYEKYLQEQGVLQRE